MGRGPSRPVRLDGEITAGSFLILPYRWDAGDPSKNEKILAHCSSLSNLFPLPIGEDERKIAVAQALTAPENVVWEVWRRSAQVPMELVGVLLLTRVVAKLDALAHFAFFDRHLVGKRPLIQTMLGWCFEQLELRRISVEIPEHLEPLIRFTRKLGFRYEGESAAADHPMTTALEHKGVNQAAQWVAKWGSRREGMHFDGTAWRAVVCLRLLREEAMTR